MTLRPFNITNTKEFMIRIQTHRGDELINKSIKIPPNFYKKLLSHPITAFGYDFDIISKNITIEFNPKFDKKDVIKALDFWIEYFVYQNKCDYILENTVNQEFELHLEELIMVREAVLKDPADTKYVRQKIRPKTIMGVDPGHDSGKGFGTFTTFITNKDGKIEFTENVLDTSNGSPFSTVDQFCYKVRTMTRKEYDKPKLYNKDLAQSANRMSRILSGLIITQSELSFQSMLDTVPVPTERPFQLGDLIVWDVDHFRRAISGDLPSQTIVLSTETQNDSFLQWVLTGTITIPNDMGGLNIGDRFDIQNDQLGVTIVDARVAEPINAGDTVRLNENREWVRALNPIDSPNFNPNIPATPALRTEPRAIGMMGEEGIVTELIGTAGENLRIGDLIYRDDNNMRWYRARPTNPPNSQGVRVVVRSTSQGEIIEGVREGTFIYPPGTIVSLIPGSTHMGFDADENVIVRINIRR